MTHIKYRMAKEKFGRESFIIQVSHKKGVERMKGKKAEYWYKSNNDLIVQLEKSHIRVRYKNGSVIKIKDNGVKYSISDFSN